MRTFLFLLLISVSVCAWAVGRESEPVPEETPEQVPEVAEPAPALPVEPTPEPIVVPQQPVRAFSLELNGENRNPEAPPIARIDLTPKTTEEHTIQLNAWFEIQVSNGRWYSIPELVQLLR